MAFQGISKSEEIARQRLHRDTRRLGERVLAGLRSFPVVGGVYGLLLGCVMLYPGAFDVALLMGLAYAPIGASQKPDLPFRKRQSCGEIDLKDLTPGARRKPRRARGIFMLGNRIEDNAEIWAANEDMRTHVFQIGSTGAGKTEALIGLAYNAMVMSSGVAYLDGKADVNLWAQWFSMARSLGREDDVLSINYMTGNADTTKKRADKLSNTTNPFNEGNSETNTQLLVDLMDAAPGGGDMWKGRAISWLSSMMPALHELRDKDLLHLHVGLIRDYAPPVKYFELMEHPELSERSRDGMRAFLSTVPGYNSAKKVQQQSQSFLDQYGFQTMQFTRILGSLADTYGHIYATKAGEVVYRDVVLNSRLLLVALPALEKSRPELANLGKINVAAMKSMMGTELGGRLEGTKRDLLDARSTNAPMPFLAIFDEFGYFMPDGAALMWAQARGLGFCLVAAGQDLQAFYRTSREETGSIVANCNIKIVGKLEDPAETYEMVRKIAGEAYVAESEGYDLDVEGLAGFRARQGVRVTRQDRITLQDLKNQVEGEIHIFIKSEIIRARTFYANPSKATAFRLNHFIKVLPPDAEEIRARRLDVRGLIASLTVEPLTELTPPADGLKALVAASRTRQMSHCNQAHLGVERGVLLYLSLCQAQNAPAVSEGGDPGAGGGLAQAHRPEANDGENAAAEAVQTTASEAESADEPVMEGMASMLGLDEAPAEAAPTVSTEPDGPDDAAIETFDGAKLETTNVFESTLAAPSLAEQMKPLAEAARPMLEGLIGEPLEGRSGEDTVEAGALDRGETEAGLRRIAMGLGADEGEAEQMADTIMTSATNGTSYPKPPRPAATPDKQETMESVMNDLAALVSGPGLS